jgi:hypothetical protein
VCRSTEAVLEELHEVAALAKRLSVTSDAAEFDVGLTTDDMFD